MISNKMAASVTFRLAFGVISRRRHVGVVGAGRVYKGVRRRLSFLFAVGEVSEMAARAWLSVCGGWWGIPDRPLTGVVLLVSPVYRYRPPSWAADPLAGK